MERKCKKNMLQSSEHQEIEQYLREEMPFYLDMLRQMVEINSFTSNPSGVDRLGKLTAEFFTELGFTAEFVRPDDAMFGHHLVLTREGTGSHKIGFVSHLDTVFSPSDEKQNDFRWREVGERIYGPGTIDIKGGTVVMYMVLDVLSKIAPDLFNETTWVLLLDSAEEVDGRDFGRLCIERLQGEETLGCFIFEAGYIDSERAHVVVARKGMATYRVEVEGRAAHAGSAHENGANAIVQMAELVQRIASFTDYERELTFDVGTVAGGSVVNRVPHFASASVEMRAYDEEAYEHGLAQMLALPQEARVASPNGDFACRVNVEVTRRTAPWPHNEGTNSLFAIWQEAGAELGLEIVPEERGGLSDGNFFWDVVPSLDALGPSGGNAHCSERSEDGSKDQEYLRRDSLVEKSLLNTVALLKLLRR